jgi:transposase
VLAVRLPRFLQFKGYDVKDFKEYLSEGRIEVHLEVKDGRDRRCNRCKTELSGYSGQHRMKIEGLPLMGHRLFIYFWRMKGFCQTCKKHRSERVHFLSELSPHYTKDYAWGLGRFCEIAPVSRVAELNNQSGMTVWRLDFARMKAMLSKYKIPKVRRISVDEVYAQNKKQFGKTRDDQFFTVITDLETRRVIWVTDSRRKEALDRFFQVIGKEACRDIRVVACDQHDAYAASVRDYCPDATLVWDRFHIMQQFEIAINETRKELHGQLYRDDGAKHLSRGKYRYIFLKKADRRTKSENNHMQEVIAANREFSALEIIKERMMSFFDERDEWSAEKIFREVGTWIYDMNFYSLKKWYDNLSKGWDTLKNYFRYRVTSAVSEGHNNVIKMLKRRAFGYRNMEYFKLKILQVCGYLNSKYINSLESLVFETKQI